MERVVFLLESTGERISCLLNPNALVMRRTAGIRSRQSVGGNLTGMGLTDDPLVYTGGGRTELELALLFDTGLAGSSIETDDVRNLTRPLWELAENTLADNGSVQAPQVRFVWGKSWNIPGVVTAIAERLEQFQMSGAPGRSWLRMRFLRVSEPIMRPAGSQAGPGNALDPEDLATLDANTPLESTTLHETTTSGTDEQPGPGERLDVLAARFYGEVQLSHAEQDMYAASFWRLIASANDIADPLHISAGTLLRIPTLAELLAAMRSQPTRTEE